MNFLIVGLGGAIGAMLRYAVSCIPYKGDFPLLTLVINITGALLIGFIAGFSAAKNIPDKYVLFLKTGVCGGYTTFSTFSLEAYQLFKDGSYTTGALYIVLSVAGSLLGIWCGMRLAKLAA